MERIRTLINRLHAQLESGVSPRIMLANARLLEQELHDQSLKEEATSPIVAEVPSVPSWPTASRAADTDNEKPVISILQVDEAEVEAELEAIKRNAQVVQQMSAHHKPSILFDDTGDPFHDAELPTLRFQPAVEMPVPEQGPDTPTVTPASATPDLNEQLQAQTPPSLNEQLQGKQGSLSLGDTLQEGPVRDLRKAIDLNDRFRFINELFRGDETMYERSIKTINSFSIWPEAEYWIRRELKVKLGWNEQDATVKHFDQMVKRRFNA
jgi:hypothetical protein